MKMRILFIFVCTTFLLACSNEDEDKHRIPWAPVHFRVNVLTSDLVLNAPSGYKSFVNSKDNFRPGGYDKLGFSGLIVVSNLIPDDSGNPSLSAYDLCCPYEAKHDLTISPTKDGKAKCNGCESIYDLYSGGKVVSGPSKWWLKSYRVIVLQPYNGTFLIEN